MKKILLLSAVLIGAVTASQAGVRFSIGIPVPAPPAVIVTPPAPVYVQPPEQVYVAPPAYIPAPPMVVAPPVLGLEFGHYYGLHYHPYYHGPYGWHRDRFHRW
jgi:hypothetical protein